MDGERLIHYANVTTVLNDVNKLCYSLAYMPMHCVYQRRVVHYCNSMHTMANIGLLFLLFIVIETPNVYTIGRSIMLCMLKARAFTCSQYITVLYRLKPMTSVFLFVDVELHYDILVGSCSD